MVDMLATIVPKSDQTNTDDLLGGPRTITITAVRGDASSKEQPVSIHYEGDGGRPFKPCKSMRRVVVHVWGPDTTIYVGRSMTLYCDPEVQFGGMKVGGIRISHMSHIDEPKSMPLTTTRARRALFTVQPLQLAATNTTAGAPSYPTLDEYAACKDAATLEQLEKRRAEHWKKVPTQLKPQLKDAYDAAAARIRAAARPEPLTALTEADAIARLEAAFKGGAKSLAVQWELIEADYSNRQQPIPLAVDAKYSELTEALKE